MSLNELLGYDGPMTHRQYLGWVVWLRAQLNVPSRADHYAMQTASAAAGGVELSKLKITFGDGDQGLTAADIDAVWNARFLGGHRNRKDGGEADG